MRKRELKLLQTAMYFQSLTISVASTVPIVSAIVMFLSHIGMGYDLSPSQVSQIVIYEYDLFLFTEVIIFIKGLRLFYNSTVSEPSWAKLFYAYRQNYFQAG